MKPPQTTVTVFRVRKCEQVTFSLRTAFQNSVQLLVLCSMMSCWHHSCLSTDSNPSLFYFIFVFFWCLCSLLLHCCRRQQKRWHSFHPLLLFFSFFSSLTSFLKSLNQIRVWRKSWSTVSSHTLWSDTKFYHNIISVRLRTIYIYIYISQMWGEPDMLYQYLRKL